MTNAQTNKTPQLEVPDCYFQLREATRVSLFHDACSHQPQHQETEAAGSGEGSVFAAMHQAMLRAKHAIFIVGWSIKDDIRLQRCPPGADDDSTDDRAASMTVGELLKLKADEGVPNACPTFFFAKKCLFLSPPRLLQTIPPS